MATGLILATRASAAPVAAPVDWPKLLSGHDLEYGTLPETSDQAAVTGNGLMEARIDLTDDKDGLRFRIARGDVTAGGKPLPIGNLVLVPVGKITGGTMHLDLWNAEVTGTVETGKGEIRFTTYTHARRPVQVIDIRPTEGERGCYVDFRPAASSGDGPPPVAGVSGDSRTVLRRLPSGGEWAAAWFVNHEAGPRRTVYLSVGWARSGHGAVAQAARAVHDAAEAMDLEGPHRAWWHAFYPAHIRTSPGAVPKRTDCLRAYHRASAPTTRPIR